MKFNGLNRIMGYKEIPRGKERYRYAYVGNGKLGFDVGLDGSCGKGYRENWKKEIGRVPSDGTINYKDFMTSGSVAKTGLTFLSQGQEIFGSHNSTPALSSYEQTLDMKDGVVYTNYTIYGYAKVKVISFVPKNESCAVVQVHVEPLYGKSIGVRMCMEDAIWDCATNYEKSPSSSKVGIREKHLFIRVTKGGGSAVCSLFSVPGGKTGKAGNEVFVESKETDKSFIVTYYISVASTLESENLLFLTKKRIARASQKGMGILRKENKQEWARFWNRVSKVKFPNDYKDWEKLYYAQLFYAECSVTEYTIGPAGLSAPTWNSISTNDVTYKIRAMLSANMVEESKHHPRFFHSILPQARKRAKDNGCKGAEFPWEATIEGNENSIPPYSEQKYTNGLVALTAYWVYGYTQDDKLLADYVYPIIKEVADYFSSWLQWNKSLNGYVAPFSTPFNEVEKYMSKGVTIASAVAKKVLLLAVDLSIKLGADEERRSKWQEIADKIYIKYDRKHYWGSLEFEYFEDNNRITDCVTPIFPAEIDVSSKRAFSTVYQVMNKIEKNGYFSVFYDFYIMAVAAVYNRQPEYAYTAACWLYNNKRNWYNIREAYNSDIAYFLTNIVYVGCINEMLAHGNALTGEISTFLIPKQWYGIQFANIRIYGAYVISGKSLKNGSVEWIKIKKKGRSILTLSGNIDRLRFVENNIHSGEVEFLLSTKEESSLTLYNCSPSSEAKIYVDKKSVMRRKANLKGEVTFVVMPGEHWYKVQTDPLLPR